MNAFAATALDFWEFKWSHKVGEASEIFPPPRAGTPAVISVTHSLQKFFTLFECKLNRVGLTGNRFSMFRTFWSIYLLFSFVISGCFCVPIQPEFTPVWMAITGSSDCNGECRYTTCPTVRPNNQPDLVCDENGYIVSM